MCLKLFSGNGAGYVSRAFRDYLNLMGIGHILAALVYRKKTGKGQFIDYAAVEGIASITGDAIMSGR